jgi:hypothetical protein
MNRKLIFAFATSFLVINTAKAQWTTTTTTPNSNFQYSGNVGIGTGVSEVPSAKLEIRAAVPKVRLADIPTRYLEISEDKQGQPFGRSWSNDNAGGRQFRLSTFSHLPDNSGSTFKDIIHFDGYNLLLLKDNGGSIGLGTSSPARLLHLQRSSGVEIKLQSNTSNWEIQSDAFDPGSFGIVDYSGGSASLTKCLVINKATGNVSIGTNDAKSYKLAVAGKMVAEEIVVQLKSNWADYVFGPQYKLPKLSEVEKYVLLHRHLPEIPSAEQVAADGLAVGAFQAQLLKKVEELTLYLIQIEKELVLLKNEGQAKDTRILQLETTLSELKNSASVNVK